jgi:hypothetical protein
MVGHFRNDKGRSDIDLETEHYKVFRNILNDRCIHVFRYTFIPFNNIGAKPHKTKFQAWTCFTLTSRYNILDSFPAMC